MTVHYSKQEVMSNYTNPVRSVFYFETDDFSENTWTYYQQTLYRDVFK